MPELPEVETIARDLRRRIVGQRVRDVWSSGKPLRLARGIDLEGLRRISLGRTVEGVRRVGKYLLIDVTRGEAAMPGQAAGAVARPAPGVLVHLGMSGRLLVEPADAVRAPHTHLVFAFDSGTELRFRDPRRFGWIASADPVDSCVELRRMGPDPLGTIDDDGLAAKMLGVRAPIKAFLLDQTKLAGLGNIYVCEALFLAGVDPRQPAGRVVGRAAALLAAIRTVLTLGIENRGTTLRDYVDASGTGGKNAAALQVYGREGEPCRRCGVPIVRRSDGGRSTFHCPECQRRRQRPRPPARGASGQPVSG